ncbi:MAG: elongation factor P [Bacteroides sp.]|nr:MAG: elongation factor P [Bacteroides sp.]
MHKASDIKIGNYIRFRNELLHIIEFIHNTPCKTRASYSAKMRNVLNDKIVNYRFRPNEEVIIEYITCKSMQYIYKNNKTYVLMDNETFEQYEIEEKLFNDYKDLLIYFMVIKVLFDSNKNPFLIQIPNKNKYIVKHVEKAVKGNTATNIFTYAELETGLKIKVPAFIKSSDVILIDTKNKIYLEKI